MTCVQICKNSHFKDTALILCRSQESSCTAHTAELGRMTWCLRVDTELPLWSAGLDPRWYPWGKEAPALLSHAKALKAKRAVLKYVHGYKKKRSTHIRVPAAQEATPQSQHKHSRKSIPKKTSLSTAPLSSSLTTEDCEDGKLIVDVESEAPNQTLWVLRCWSRQGPSLIKSAGAKVSCVWMATHWDAVQAADNITELSLPD